MKWKGSNVQVTTENPELLVIEVSATRYKRMVLFGVALALVVVAVFMERGTLNCDAEGLCTVTRYQATGISRDSFLRGEIREVELVHFRTGRSGAIYRIELMTTRGDIPLTRKSDVFRYREMKKLEKIEEKLSDPAPFRIGHGPTPSSIFFICLALGCSGWFYSRSISGEIRLDVRQNKLSVRLKGPMIKREEDFALDQVEGFGRRPTILDDTLLAEKEELYFLRSVGQDVPFLKGESFEADEAAGWSYRIQRFLKEMQPPLEEATEVMRDEG